MNKSEYMAALRQALSGLPDEERANALRYYEEYFDDAGPENEARAVEQLGTPASVAAQILADYRELTTAPAGGSAAPAPAPKTWRGINPWLLALLVIFAIPIGVPLAAAFAALILALMATLLVVVLALLVVVAVVPLTLLLTGGAFIVLSFFLWATPPSAVATLGAGLFCLAFGVLLGILMVKLCSLFIPPLFRGVVAVLRWPFDRIRGVKR